MTKKELIKASNQVYRDMPKLKKISKYWIKKNVMNQCLVFDNKKNVQMKNTKLILSEQIVYNNPFDKVLNYPGECNMFLLYRLGSYAEANKACDSTYDNYENDLYGRSYEW